MARPTSARPTSMPTFWKTGSFCNWSRTEIRPCKGIADGLATIVGATFRLCVGEASFVGARAGLGADVKVGIAVGYGLSDTVGVWVIVGVGVDGLVGSGVGVTVKAGFCVG